MEVLKELAVNIYSGMTLAKIIIAMAMVVFLSWLAEKSSPKTAGLVAGFPLGGAISLFFIGLEIGPEFAGESAISLIVGLIGTQSFVAGYYIAAVLTADYPKFINVPISIITGLALFFAAGFILREVDVGLFGAVLISSASIVIFDRFFQRIRNIRIEEANGGRLTTTLCRAGFSALVILLVTSSASLVGAKWAGLLSAFPFTILPLVAIIHYSYLNEHAYSIIKNVPRGLASLMIYSLAVSGAYPELGVYWGTAAGYVLAGIYLFAFNFRPPLPSILRQK